MSRIAFYRHDLPVVPDEDTDWVVDFVRRKEADEPIAVEIMGIDGVVQVSRELLLLLLSPSCHVQVVSVFSGTDLVVSDVLHEHQKISVLVELLSGEGQESAVT